MTEFEGFEYTFEKVREENGLDTVRALYLTIEKLLEKIHDLDSDLLEYYSRGQWYSLYVYPAIWLSDLQTVPWLPADNGSRSIPNRLFHPDLQPILGPGFSYVHEKVGIRQGSKLARLLGIRQEASTEDVLKYLADLSAERGDNAEIVKPIYEWLSKRPSQETPLIRQRFQGSPLILIPGRGWFRTNEICWRDPTGTVPEAVEDWPDLKAFFCHTLQIPENPHPDLLARTLLGWAEREPRPDLPRIQKLASALCEQWDKLSAEVQNRLKSEECWPARVGDEIRWERASHISHIYLRDREHIASLFGNALPWWALDGLENLAEKIGVPKVSTARQEIRPIGSPQPDPMLTARLKYIWPFVVRFAQPSKLPDAAPQVQRVAEIEVRYHVGGRSSRPDKVESHLDLDQWCLYLSEKTEQRLAHHIGDALKRALEVPHLREFLKDIWDQIESTAYLKEILISWERERDVCLRDLLATFSERGRSPEAPSLVQPEREAECSLLIAPSPVPIASDLAQPHKVAREREGEKEGHLQYWTAVPTAVQPPKDRESPQKDQIEKDAMLEAIQWWLKRGYEVGDVSDRTRRGYDLEVTKEGITYCVEVKGTAREERISITEHEWHTAEEKGEQYYLHVVTIPERESYLIQSPAHMLESEANPRERTVTQVYYEIPFSAITRLAKRE
ncbi:MAG: DUF3883 domain-containing protein [Thermoflexales bacterium]|nr:DUF3883 domain-containing protein [Thermoflexales bacterium]